MGNENTPGKRSFSVSRINMGMLIGAALLSAILIFSISVTMQSYTSMQKAAEVSLLCRKAAEDMMDGSDSLTENARNFVSTGDLFFAEAFVTEIEVTQRREMALASLAAHYDGTESYRHLERALEKSNLLAGREYEAMALAADIYGISPEDLPEGIRKVDLGDTYAGMDLTEKKNAALDLVFGAEYQEQKEGIRGEVTSCLDTLVQMAEEEQTDRTEHFQSLLRRQRILIAALLVIVTLVAAINYYLIIKPLMTAAACIRREEALPMSRSKEMNLLAGAYNRMSEETRRNQEELSYEASHDSLTGLYNRSVFESMRSSVNATEIAMILVDVDAFKSVNDNYGHDTGDRVLKKVADLLKHSFRAEDYVCRIGGDEFAIIMLHASSAHKDLVYKKMINAITILGNPDDDLPAVTLSVGVAFGDRENPTPDIYKDADTALYRVKNLQKGDCAFY